MLFIILAMANHQVMLFGINMASHESIHAVSVNIS